MSVLMYFSIYLYILKTMSHTDVSNSKSAHKSCSNFFLFHICNSLFQPWINWLALSLTDLLIWSTLLYVTNSFPLPSPYLVNSVTHPQPSLFVDNFQTLSELWVTFTQDAYFILLWLWLNMSHCPLLHGHLPQSVWASIPQIGPIPCRHTRIAWPRLLVP